MEKIWPMQGLTHTEKLVLLALADNANNEGHCWPGLKKIAWKCSIAKQNVINAVKKLESKGVLTVERGGGRMNSNRYQINGIAPIPYEQDKQSCNDTESSSEKVSLRDQERVSLRSKGYRSDTRNGIAPIPEPSYNRQEPSVSTSNGTILNGEPDAPKPPKFKIPTLEAIRLEAAKIGLPDAEADKFFDYYSANGWKVGKNPMKSWPAALRNWKRNWEERRYENRSRSNPNTNRNAYTTKPPEDLGRLAEEKARRDSEMQVRRAAARLA